MMMWFLLERTIPDPNGWQFGPRDRRRGRHKPSFGGRSRALTTG